MKVQEATELALGFEAIAKADKVTRPKDYVEAMQAARNIVAAVKVRELAGVELEELLAGALLRYSTEVRKTDAELHAIGMRHFAEGLVRELKAAADTVEQNALKRIRR